MADASAFGDAVFLGFSSHSKRDPYRLGLFARHLAEGEEAAALLAVREGTLVVTDRRIIEFRAHLEVHGAWNVKEFQGYEVHREWSRSAVRDLTHDVTIPASGQSSVEDRITLVLADRAETLVVSRGPESTLSSGDFELLRRAVLAQPK